MIHLDLHSNQPIYEQIIHQYRLLIIQGYLKKGDGIPSVRKLALSLGITPGTVAKAYQEMERQGMIETIRGKGAFVAEPVAHSFDGKEVAQMEEQMRKQCMELFFMGLEKEDIIKMIENICDSIKKGEKSSD